MSCYFRYLRELFAEAGVRVTPANKRELDQLIHAHVGVPYKKCMPDCWSKVKPAIQDRKKRAALIDVLQQ